MPFDDYDFPLDDDDDDDLDPEDEAAFQRALEAAGLTTPTPDAFIQPASDRSRAAVSYTEDLDDEFLAREIVRLKINGMSERRIRQQLHISQDRQQRLIKLAVGQINAETRELAKHWQALKVMQWENVAARLIPHVAIDPDYVGVDADGNPRIQPAPDPKDVSAFRNVTLVELQVMTLGRAGATVLPEDEDIIDVTAEETADKVVEYMNLAQKMIEGVRDARYGSGEYTGPDVSEEEEALERANQRADNSLTIDDAYIVGEGEVRFIEPVDGGNATVLDARGSATDEELDARPGEWRDGKFYPNEAND